MCNAYSILFGAINLRPDEVKDKKILEVGSYDTNGSLRRLVESYRPAEYIGVDIQKGPGVDFICRAEDILNKFGKESFDLVISTEMLEHVKDWKKAIHNMKVVCKPEGGILITTRSRGCPYHSHPYDFWRFELKDMRYIFSDCVIENLEKDPLMGVFVKVRRPEAFLEKDLSDYDLYSILFDKRIKEIPNKGLQRYLLSMTIKEKIRNFIYSLQSLFFIKN